VGASDSDEGMYGVAVGLAFGTGAPLTLYAVRASSVAQQPLVELEQLQQLALISHRLEVASLLDAVAQLIFCAHQLPPDGIKRLPPLASYAYFLQLLARDFFGDAPPPQFFVPLLLLVAVRVSFLQLLSISVVVVVVFPLLAV
jgi:hypothetical protein